MLGSQLAMPVLVINMGGEMIYILQQRLHAQNIPDDKARKVLEDVVRTMYTPVFLDELFKPQEMYTNSSTKQIFDKLAHSSIMRLNKQSMEKLYDLMSMGVKFQLLSCTCPQQYLQITLQHLDALVNIVQSTEVQPLIQSAISRCLHMYTSLTQANWLLLQQTLMQFFQGRKVKVSLFLSQELQTMTGTLVLKHQGKLPFNAEAPGVIRYFENGRVVNSHRFQTALDGLVEPVSQVFDHSSSMGKNMYMRPTTDASGATRTPASFRDAEEAFARIIPASTHRHDAGPAAMPKSSGISDSGSKITNSNSAKAEWSLLADLLGGSEGDSKGGSKGGNFHVNLVQARGFAKDEEGGKAGDDGDDFFTLTIDIDASAGAKTVDTYMRELDLRDDRRAEGKRGADDDEDDLLALMDSAK